MKSKILVIEDDPDILEMVEYNLSIHNYDVLTSLDGAEGLKIAQQIRPHLILLDVMLPEIDGLEICRKLKANPETAAIPIIIVTAKTQETDVVVGLELGADDYLAKPFSINVLLARIRVALRRGVAPQETWGVPSNSPTKDTIIFEGLVIDSKRHEVFYQNEPLFFTLTEFKLLLALAKQPGFVFSREQLLNEINDHDVHVIDRNIDVHIRSIRKKIGEDSGLISTVRGVGYKCNDRIGQANRNCM